MYTLGIILLTVATILVLVDLTVAMDEDTVPGGMLTITYIIAIAGMYLVCKG